MEEEEKVEPSKIAKSFVGRKRRSRKSIVRYPEICGINADASVRLQIRCFGSPTPGAPTSMTKNVNGCRLTSTHYGQSIVGYEINPPGQLGDATSRRKNEAGWGELLQKCFALGYTSTSTTSFGATSTASPLLDIHRTRIWMLWRPDATVATWS